MRTKEQLTNAIRAGGPAVLVVNARSRRAGRVAAELPDLLHAAGVRLVATHLVEDPTELKDIVEQVLAGEPDLLVFAGGDGSAATAVALLADRDSALGLLPLGTTNNFARSLKLPLSPARAVGVLRTGRVVDVDLGRAETADGSYVFANMASIGLSAQVAQHVPHELKRRLGRAAYALTGARALPGHEPFRAIVSADGDSQELWTHQLNVANGGFHAGRAIARQASVDDRQLLAYSLGGRSRLSAAVASAAQAVLGPRRDLMRPMFTSARCIRVQTDPQLPVDIDGELRGLTPLTVTIAGEALRIFAPADFVDT